MPKKVKTISKSTKATNDFHFIVIISVFAALTIFAANYMAQANLKAIQARKQTLPVAQLDLSTPNLKAVPKTKTKPLTNPTPQPTMIPWHK